MIDIYAIKDSLSINYEDEINFITSKGNEVELVIYEDKVKVLDCFKYQRIERFEVLVYLTNYLQSNSISYSRSINNFEGEWKAHALAYQLNIDKEKSADADLEFDSDSRWYVSTASLIIQFFGL